MTAKKQIGRAPGVSDSGCDVWRHIMLNRHVVGQPGDPEDHHHHQHRLCGLGEGKEAEALITTGEKGRKQRRWSQQAGAQHPSSCTDRGNFLYIFTESSAS